MKLIDYAPCVLDALRSGDLNSGDLSEQVFGSSGRNSPKLVNSLFPFCIRCGWVVVVARGRSKVFSLTPVGRTLVESGNLLDRWDYTTHTFK